MKAKLIKNTDSKLYNRGSKKYVADLLSDKGKNIIFRKCEKFYEKIGTLDEKDIKMKILI